ncbi:MlaD family protein [Geitlerinema sp. PCC 7407]|uniref:MlaD family protein n=1 Tax=Geitlerinema sp. PCC 7407 TaxID=1173025 RepID=UPI00029F95B2|nr:MlaD family protein [Geitlerinema sp. PCC 7407]AFY67253.1 Mammalian cell entry related domain protein [Geitlerinema sp. PCC 7407]
MRARTIREGSVGLLILLGLGLAGGLILWLKGFNPANRSYQATVDFANTGGIQPGAPVRYRGVTVGRVTRVQPAIGSVEVDIEISSADLLIPRNVLIESNQSGFIGEVAIDITPLVELTRSEVDTRPLDPDCDESLIVCDGTRLSGSIGVNFDELIRATLRLTNLLTDPEMSANINSLTKNASDAAAGIAGATEEIAVLSRNVSSLTQAANQELRAVSASTVTTSNAVGQAAAQLGLTANQASELLAANRVALTGTLTNLNATSGQLRQILTDLSPALSREGEVANRLNVTVRNLELLTTNAAQASEAVRNASVSLNNPETVLLLQQTLDAARATFQNTQKITSDLDDLTGDPSFRDDLKRLVEGLGGLVSSTQQLNEQTQIAQQLAPLGAIASVPTKPSAAGVARSPDELPGSLLQLDPPESPADLPAEAAESSLIFDTDSQSADSPFEMKLGN